MTFWIQKKKKKTNLFTNFKHQFRLFRIYLAVLKGLFQYFANQESFNEKKKKNPKIKSFVNWNLKMFYIFCQQFLHWFWQIHCAVAVRLQLTIQCAATKHLVCWCWVTDAEDLEKNKVTVIISRQTATFSNLFFFFLSLFFFSPLYMNHFYTQINYHKVYC